MRFANVIEGGLAGATTLSLIQEALHTVDAKTPQPFLHKSDALKKLKKNSGKKGGSAKLYVKLAGELLSAAPYFGLSGLGKKKNTVLRGGLLGATAGLAIAFLNEDEKDTNYLNGNSNGIMSDKDALQKKIVTVALYTAGGMLAGVAIKKLNKKTFKKLAKGLKEK